MEVANTPNLNPTDWLSEGTLKGFRSGEFRNIFLQERPFHYLCIDNFLRKEVFQTLLRQCQSSPKEPNKSKFGLSYQRDINWGYFPNLNFLRTIYSKRIRSLLETTIGETLSPRKGAPPQLAEFLPGSKGFDCHTDNNEKFDLVTLLYFTDPENMPKGGEYCIHNETLEIKDKLIPLPNRFIMFKVSNTSYHSVSNVEANGGPRLNLTADWILPDSERAQQRKIRVV